VVIEDFDRELSSPPTRTNSTTEKEFKKETISPPTASLKETLPKSNENGSSENENSTIKLNKKNSSESESSSTSTTNHSYSNPVHASNALMSVQNSKTSKTMPLITDNNNNNNNNNNSRNASAATAVGPAFSPSNTNQLSLLNKAGTMPSPSSSYFNNKRRISRDDSPTPPSSSLSHNQQFHSHHLTGSYANSASYQQGSGSGSGGEHSISNQNGPSLIVKSPNQKFTPHPLSSSITLNNPVNNNNNNNSNQYGRANAHDASNSSSSSLMTSGNGSKAHQPLTKCNSAPPPIGIF
jgi:hypothetical protein